MESQRTIPSEEEIKEFKKLLNHINKPPIKIFQTEHGDILDCIDIQKQRAFDHPLLKNHSIQLKPTTIPKWTRDNNTFQKSTSLPFRQENLSCPFGTVIVKRTTLEDLIQTQHLKSLGLSNPNSKDRNIDTTGYHFAVAEYKANNYGATGYINVWDLHVSPNQFSRASIHVSGGNNYHLQSISAGWIVNQRLKNNHSSLSISWTTDSDNISVGCFNTRCPGFVQVSTKFPLGILVHPVSTYNGEQFHLVVSLFQDHGSGNWWFMLRDDPIGYWPKSLFKTEGLANGASWVYWGGEVFSPVKEKSPTMGSGHYAQEGFRKAAYINGIKVIDHVSRKFFSPTTAAIQTYANNPGCYNVETKSGTGEFWSRAVFYGGPGGCTF
ncbi:unnamed protein product [Arabis nemorensis]|uniref:Neprosin PEP catalytic domain-containing protein n=1 Tax=Arabis nemorensis TaxID=586526 RepID=A0A565CE95_9BRAS|nr:unnamed protein product [Arabis nemorensis]